MEAVTSTVSMELWKGAWMAGSHNAYIPPFGSTQQGKHRAGRMSSRRRRRQEKQAGTSAGVAKQNGMGARDLSNGARIYSEKWNGDDRTSTH
jgi:hypothetical protein